MCVVIVRVSLVLLLLSDCGRLCVFVWCVGMSGGVVCVFLFRWAGVLLFVGCGGWACGARVGVDPCFCGGGGARKCTVFCRGGGARKCTVLLRRWRPQGHRGLAAGGGAPAGEQSSGGGGGAGTARGVQEGQGGRVAHSTRRAGRPRTKRPRSRERAGGQAQPHSRPQEASNAISQ